jgi:hypothetical protein
MAKVVGVAAGNVVLNWEKGHFNPDVRVQNRLNILMNTPHPPEVTKRILEAALEVARAAGVVRLEE